MNILIFGGTGSIGSEISEFLVGKNENPIIATRKTNVENSVYVSNSFNELKDIKVKIDAVIWCQGANINDTIESSDDFTQIFEANVTYVIDSLKVLLSSKLLANNARLLVISSIWQNLSRKNKFSYTVSKSAISGLIKSITADYGRAGFTINALLPGVVENKMTFSNLSKAQILKISQETPSQKLVNQHQIASVAYWLISQASSGVAGQSIVIDNGWSQTREI